MPVLQHFQSRVDLWYQRRHGTVNAIYCSLFDYQYDFASKSNSIIDFEWQGCINIAVCNAIGAANGDSNDPFQEVDRPEQASAKLTFIRFVVTVVCFSMKAKIDASSHG